MEKIKEKVLLSVLSAFVLLTMFAGADAEAWWYPRAPVEYDVYYGAQHDYTQCVVSYDYERTAYSWSGNIYNLYSPNLGLTEKIDQPVGIVVSNNPWKWYDYSMCANYDTVYDRCSRYDGYWFQYCMNNGIVNADARTQYVRVY